MAHLIEALTTNDRYIKALIHNLPNNWSRHNVIGTLITKTQLLRSAWGELKKASPPLQALLQVPDAI